jgi:hypothetical protein
MGSPSRNDMKKQTAVDYIFQELWQSPKDKWMWQMILNQAKEIEKEHIEKAFDIGLCDGFDYGFIEDKTTYETGEQYYKQTYGDE